MNRNPTALYCFTESEGIDVDCIPLAQADSMSIMLPTGECCIAINPQKMKSSQMETVCLAHELGHCETGSFYNCWAAFDIRERHEYKADKWAVMHLISVDDLDKAVADGCMDVWSLAERFNVTVDFIKKAVCWYTYGNLAVNLYF